MNREIERGFAQASRQNYMKQVGTTPDGRPTWTPTAKGAAQMMGDIILGYVAQADQDGHRDLNDQERAELIGHVEHLLDLLRRS